MATQDGSHRLHLLAVDPDLATGLAGERYAKANTAVVAAGFDVPQGVSRELRDLTAGDTIVLLLEGFAARLTAVHGRASAELYGPGEMLGNAEAETEVFAVDRSWRALTAMRVAVLDDEAMTTLAAWPEVVTQLLLRGTRRSSRVSSVRAILALPGVDLRVLAYLWHLAARWGRVATTGVALDVPLSHAMLGDLLGARRPTITAALGRLRRAGLLAPVRGGWRLATDVSGLEAEGVPADLSWEILTRRIPAAQVAQVMREGPRR